jgi:aspartate oxidase
MQMGELVKLNEIMVKTAAESSTKREQSETAQKKLEESLKTVEMHDLFIKRTKDELKRLGEELLKAVSERQTLLTTTIPQLRIASNRAADASAAAALVAKQAKERHDKLLDDDLDRNLVKLPVVTDTVVSEEINNQKQV